MAKKLLTEEMIDSFYPKQGTTKQSVHYIKVVKISVSKNNGMNRSFR